MQQTANRAAIGREGNWRIVYVVTRERERDGRYKLGSNSADRGEFGRKENRSRLCIEITIISIDFSSGERSLGREKVGAGNFA